MRSCRAIANSFTKSEPDLLVENFIIKNFTGILEDVLNLVQTRDQSELFENILISVGNMITISESIRLKIFSANLFDLIFIKYDRFEEDPSVSEYMIWLLSNTLSDKFVLQDSLQFILIQKITAIFYKHGTEQNFVEALWAVKYFLNRKSKNFERLDCLEKTKFMNKVENYVKRQLGTDCGDCLSLALDVLKIYYSLAGSNCKPDLVEVTQIKQFLMKAIIAKNLSDKHRYYALNVLQAISSDENIDSSILRVMVINLNCLSSVASIAFETKSRCLALVVMFNIMSSISEDYSRDFLLQAISNTVLFLSLLEFFEEEPELALHAAECLHLILRLGGVLEEQSEIGEPNPVVEYCLQHEGMEYLERAQKTTHKDLRNVVKDIINKFFT